MTKKEFEKLHPEAKSEMMMEEAIATSELAMKEEKKIKNSKYTAVLAGNFREFNLFAKGDVKYIYANDSNKLAGLEIEDVITVGTWYEQEDAFDILEFAKTRIRIANLLT